MTDTARVRDELSAAWAIARKDMQTYYFKPNIIVSGILFPLFMFFAFATGKDAPLATLVPGLVSLTLLFSASSIEPVSIPIERRVKTFDRLLAAPISMHSLVLGESVSGFFYSLVIASLPLGIGVFFLGTTVMHPWVLASAVCLAAFCFAAMGTLFAAYPTESVGEVMSMLNLVRLPLIFISGVFIPLASMPPAGQAAALFSPLTYAYDLVQYACSGTGHLSPLTDVAILSAFILAFHLAAHHLYQRFNG